MSAQDKATCKGLKGFLNKFQAAAESFQKNTAGHLSERVIQRHHRLINPIA